MWLIHSIGGGPKAMPDMFAYPASLESFENCSISPQWMIRSQKPDTLIGLLYRTVKAKGQEMLRKTTY